MRLASLRNLRAGKTLEALLFYIYIYFFFENGKENGKEHGNYYYGLYRGYIGLYDIGLMVEHSGLRASG